MGGPSGVGSYVDDLISFRVIAVILSRYMERVYSRGMFRRISGYYFLHVDFHRYWSVQKLDVKRRFF